MSSNWNTHISLRSPLLDLWGIFKNYLWNPCVRSQNFRFCFSALGPYFHYFRQAHSLAAFSHFQASIQASIYSSGTHIIDFFVDRNSKNQVTWIDCSIGYQSIICDVWYYLIRIIIWEFSHKCRGEYFLVSWHCQSCTKIMIWIRFVPSRPFSN